MGPDWPTDVLSDRTSVQDESAIRVLVKRLFGQFDEEVQHALADAICLKLNSQRASRQEFMLAQQQQGLAADQVAAGEAVIAAEANKKAAELTAYANLSPSAPTVKDQDAITAADMALEDAKATLRAVAIKKAAADDAVAGIHENTTAAAACSVDGLPDNPLQLLASLIVNNVCGRRPLRVRSSHSAHMLVWAEGIAERIELAASVQAVADELVECFGVQCRE